MSVKESGNVGIIDAWVLVNVPGMRSLRGICVEELASVIPKLAGTVEARLGSAFVDATV